MSSDDADVLVVDGDALADIAILEDCTRFLAVPSATHLRCPFFLS